MATKKKNNKNQTFDVYPYLDQYQYLMRDGGALPWYQTKGPVETKRKYTVEGVEYDTYEEFVEAWNKKMPNANPPPKEYLDKQYDNNTGTHNSTDQPVDNECVCPEGSENAGTTYLSSGGCGYSRSMCGKMIDGTVPRGYESDYPNGESPVETPVSPNADYFQKEKENLGLLPWEEGYTEENDAHDPNRVAPPAEEEEVVEEVKEVEEVGDPLVGDATTPIAETTDDQKLELGDLEQQYKDGKISRRELEESRKSYNTSGKRYDGTTKGNTQFETLPGSAWNLLGNALQSTNKFTRNLGKTRINPKTGKEYQKSDFKENTIDWTNMSNENKANIYFDEENLQKFTDGDGDDLALSELFKTKTMNNAENFNKHQAEQIKLEEESGQDKLFSRQTQSRFGDGQISYDDIEYEEMEEMENPEFDPNKPEGPDNLKMTSVSVNKTRKHTDDDLTAGDIAKDKLKDNSTTEIIFDENGAPVEYKGFGSDASGSGMGTWDYDPNEKYGQYTETTKISNEQQRENLRKGLNMDGTTKTPPPVVNDAADGEKTETGRVTNEDFSVTITYSDGSTKTMNESSQGRSKRLNKGKMGLETFVYGGQPSNNKLSLMDMYSKGGSTLRKFLTGEEIEEAEENLEADEEVALTDEELAALAEAAPGGQGDIADNQGPLDFMDDDINFTDEEINTMDEETLGDTDLVKSESTYGKGTQGLKNWWGATTKAGTSGKVSNSLANFGQAGADWADFGNAVMDGWANDAKEAKSENEGNTAADMYAVQSSDQGIYDTNSGDGWTNKKTDEIYAGNTMAGPLIMQMGGTPPAQQQAPVEDIDFSALAQFADNNAWDSEVSYSPEVMAYQKQIMGKMRDGGSLPIAEEGWWDGMKKGASNLYDTAKETYDNTDFKTPINTGLDYLQTAGSAAGMIPVVGNAVDLVNASVSGARAGYAGYTGDTEGVKDHTENAALNLASAIPGAGQIAGATALAKDTAKYAGQMDGSLTTNIASAIQGDDKDKNMQVAENTQTPKINKVARDGGEQELEVDYELLQELIKAGADIEII